MEDLSESEKVNLKSKTYFRSQQQKQHANNRVVPIYNELEHINQPINQLNVKGKREVINMKRFV